MKIEKFQLRVRASTQLGGNIGIDLHAPTALKIIPGTPVEYRNARSEISFPARNRAIAGT
jgi:hypothetical protein